MGNFFKYGLYLGLTLIAYFILIDLIGLADQIYFSFFNAILTGGSLYLAIKDVYRIEKDEFKYMDGYQAALLTGLIGSTLFTVFMAIYFFEIRPELAASIQEQIAVAGDSTYALLMFVFLSGVATSVVSAIILIPIFKKSWNTRQVRKEQQPLKHKA
jgi:hypothetical protein